MRARILSYVHKSVAQPSEYMSYRSCPNASPRFETSAENTEKPLIKVNLKKNFCILRFCILSSVNL